MRLDARSRQRPGLGMAKTEGEQKRKAGSLHRDWALPTSWSGGVLHTQTSVPASTFGGLSVFSKPGAQTRLRRHTLHFTNRYSVMTLGIDRYREPGPPESPFGRE